MDEAETPANGGQILMGNIDPAERLRSEYASRASRVSVFVSVCVTHVHRIAIFVRAEIACHNPGDSPNYARCCGRVCFGVVRSVRSIANAHQIDIRNQTDCVGVRFFCVCKLINTLQVGGQTI